MAMPTMGGSSNGRMGYTPDASFNYEDYSQQRLQDLTELRNGAYRKSEEYLRNLIDLRYQEEEKRLKQRYALEEKVRVAVDTKYEKKKDALVKKAAAAKKAEDKAAEARYKKEIAQLEEKHKKEVENAEKVAKTQELTQNLISKLNDRNATVLDKAKAVWGTVSGGDTLGQGFTAALDGIVSSLSDFAKQMDQQIDQIASYKSRIDTRLYGLGGGRSWDNISKTITGVAGISPFVTQANYTKNLNALVEKGIAFNIEQRAFLETIKDKIATTFDAANGTLLQLVRVQQADSTAARLGSEAALTEFLNAMYENTEYLGSIAEGVTGNIYEATAQLSAREGVAFEYQVQKWLGSLYSVGMSQQGVSSISKALGMLGSGDVSGLASNAELQNLLVMSANRAGLSYAELLANGLDASDTNALMREMVEYLSEISNSNKVVQSQYAAVFGMSVSDIKAASNLVGSLSAISGNSLGYSSAIDKLYDMADTMYQRTSIGEMMSNIWDNTQYGMAAGVASNPVLYAMYKASGLLDDLVGGINIPYISVMGTGVDLETTVADLMRVGALSGGILSSIGQMIAAGSGGGLFGGAMLNAVGVSRGNSMRTVSRGSGLGVNASGRTTSSSSYMVANASGSDVLSSTMASADDQKNASLVEAQAEDNSVTLDIVDSHIVDIYNLISGMSTGDALRVRIENYGLSWS